MSAPRKTRLPRAANDNDPPRKALRCVVDIPADLPIQSVEVEILAQLLDALPPAANDNSEDGS